jgi:plasmid stabilization system protein ParE
MKARIVLRPFVPADLIEIASFLSDQRPALGHKLFASFHSTLDWLSEFPGAGSPKHFRQRHLAGLRTWPVRGFDDYLIFYRVANGEIVVLAVLHGKRNLPKALRGRS